MAKKKKMPIGGAVSPEDAAISKILMERNRGKNFVDRAFDYKNAPTVPTNSLPGNDLEGNPYSSYNPKQHSSHLMGWSPTEDGRNIVFPYLTEDRPGHLQYQGGEEGAMNHALQTGQYIEAPTQHIADALSGYGYKKAAGIPTYKDGGNIPTKQDSLDLYNNAKQVNDYYKKKGYTTQQDLPYQGNLIDDLESNFQNFQGVGNLPQGVDYRKIVDANRLMQREGEVTQLDSKAPMPLYDKRIKPQRQVTYLNEKPGDPLVGDRASVMQYDPIAVKPYDMLTSQEKVLRNTQYKQKNIVYERDKGDKIIQSNVLHSEKDEPNWFRNEYGGIMKKTPKKILNKVMPIKAWDGANIEDPDHPLYSMPQRDPAFYPATNDQLGSVAAQPNLNPMNDLTGQNAVAVHPNMNDSRFNNPNSHSDMNWQALPDDPAKVKPKPFNPLAGKSISGHFDTADMTMGLISGIDGILQDTKKKDNQQLMKPGEQKDPYGVRGSQAIFADGGTLNRDNFNALHTYAYQNAQNYGGDQYNHGTYGNDIINAFNQTYPSQAVQPQDIQRYQQDMQANPQAMAGSQGFSPIDNKFGSKTMQQSYMNYATEHYDRYGKLVKEDSKFFGTNQGAASDQHKYNIANPTPKEWTANNQGIPMTEAPKPLLASKKVQKGNFHTNENADYSIDSVRMEDGGEVDFEDEALAGIRMLGDGQVSAMSDAPNPMLKFEGPSHEEGGIPLIYGEQGAEVQGGETAHISPIDGSLHVDGAMKMPNLGVATRGLAGRSFQAIGKEIGERENKVVNMGNKADALAKNVNIRNKFSGLSMGSSQALADAANQNMKAIEAQKEHMAMIQENMRAIADNKGVDAKKAHTMFKNGGVLDFQKKAMKEHPDWVKEALAQINPKTGKAYGEPKAGKFDDGLDGPRTQFVRDYIAKKGATPFVANMPHDKIDKIPYTTDNLTPEASPVPSSIPIDKPGPTPARKQTSMASSNKLGLSDYAPALGYLFDHPQQVVGQQYNPNLMSPYQVSFQDRMNNNQSTFNSIQKQLTNSGQAGALGSLAAQKYDADNQVAGEEFRANQGIANTTQNANYQIMNDAAKTNLSLADQQMVRQSQAKSNTDAHRAQALSYISDMVAQNRHDNAMIRLIEQKDGGYRQNPLTGKVEWQGPDAMLAGGPGGAESTKGIVTREYDADNNLTKVIKKSEARWGGMFSSRK